MLLRGISMDLASILTQIDDVLYTWLLIYLLPGILAIIMADAFNFKSIFGGFTGSCMVLGIKRGLFSNEAGMGSAPNASASATVSHPAKQGLAQIISVYIDTLAVRCKGNRTGRHPLCDCHCLSVCFYFHHRKLLLRGSEYSVHNQDSARKYCVQDA